MDVLILTQWYVPEPAILMHELAQSLTQRGHGVTVLTGFPNYPSGKLYPGYRLRLSRRETLAGVSVVRVPLFPDHSRSSLGRTLNYLSFALSSALLGPWLLTKPDVIFVYHPPLTVGLPGWVLSRLWRVPFVYQIQDMWPETLGATGMLDSPMLLDFIGRFARWIYGKAAAICVISHGFCDNLVGKGVPRDKIRVISNWVDTELYHPAVPDLEMAERLGLAGRFNVMFAGNVGEAQGLGVLIAAAERLRDLDAVQFVVVGDGVALPELRRAAEAQGLDNIRFLGRHPVSSMPALYALADVLLVHLKDDPLFRMTIPHKIFAYLASGKPVLAAVTGDAAAVVEDARAGVVCPPDDPVALATTVRELHAMPQVQLDQMGREARVAVCSQYSREVLTSQLEAVLASLI